MIVRGLYIDRSKIMRILDENVLLEHFHMDIITGRLSQDTIEGMLSQKHLRFILLNDIRVHDLADIHGVEVSVRIHPSDDLFRNLFKILVLLIEDLAFQR